MKIQTADNGTPNGFLVPIWNVRVKPELRPDQVYMTAVAPRSKKGPHLHMKRRGLLCCVSGNVRIVTRVDGHYHTQRTGQDFDYAVIEVPPGVPAAIYNDELREALVLNMPSPSWSADDPDDWPVENWSQPRVVVCLVGMLVGDAWMTLGPLIDLCAAGNDVRLISGSYALPVWKWAQRNVEGATFTIERVIADPDDANNPYCPGYGQLAMQPALEFIRAEMPDDIVIGNCDLGSDYNRPPRLRTRKVTTEEKIVIHPYTRHDWKNCAGVVGEVMYAKPVELVGLPGEIVADRGWKDMTNDGFDAMVDAVLSSGLFVGVLSSFTNLAAIFGKRQVIVSFTSDVPINNALATVLVEPTLEALQAVVTKEESQMLSWSGAPVFGREVSLKSALSILHERRSPDRVPLIVELGCCPAYNLDGLGNAILAYTFYAGRHGARITSVDIEGDPLHQAQMILKEYLPEFESLPTFVHQDAIKWAPGVTEPIDFLYMDAAMELEYPELYAAFNPECFQPGALMLFDDTDPKTFAGKGRTIIPQLLKEGTWREVEWFARVPVFPMVLLERV